MKAIFLDRDGTLVEDPGYVHNIEDFKLHFGVLEGLKKLKKYMLFIVTNQSGIGRGIYSEKDMHKFNQHLQYGLHGINIEKIYFCPHRPDEKCDCRKPNEKFVKEAEKEFDLDLENSYVIGDHDSDIMLAKNSGCKSVFLLTGQGVLHLQEAQKLNPDYIATDLNQAADFILSNNEKVVKREKIADLVAKLRREDKKIVTLNGAFDILHKGHEKILEEAKQQGDILIVAVNSDSSVKASKGKGRPINNEENRARMLTSYDYVDYVTIFDEKTPIEMLEIIKPNVHVNGSEYGEECVEAEVVRKFGGKIHIVELLKGLSTTNIIK